MFDRVQTLSYNSREIERWEICPCHLHRLLRRGMMRAAFGFLRGGHCFCVHFRRRRLCAPFVNAVCVLLPRAGVYFFVKSVVRLGSALLSRALSGALNALKLFK